MSKFKSFMKSKLEVDNTKRALFTLGASGLICFGGILIASISVLLGVKLLAIVFGILAMFGGVLIVIDLLELSCGYRHPTYLWNGLYKLIEDYRNYEEEEDE